MVSTVSIFSDAAAADKAHYEDLEKEREFMAKMKPYRRKVYLAQRVMVSHAYWSRGVGNTPHLLISPLPPFLSLPPCTCQKQQKRLEQAIAENNYKFPNPLTK